MKRSTFLKTLGLSAAAAFCNCRVFAVPRFALPGPGRPDAQLPAELAREDLLQHILDGALEFARDGIRVGPVDPAQKLVTMIYDRSGSGEIRSERISMDRSVLHMAMESGGVKMGQEMCGEDVRQFTEAIRYVLEELVRDRESRAARLCRWAYTDPIPAKFNSRGVRIYPYNHSVSEATLNPLYETAPETRFIPKLVHPIFEMRMEVTARVMFDVSPVNFVDEETIPVGWCARAVLTRGDL